MTHAAMVTKGRQPGRGAKGQLFLEPEYQVQRTVFTSRSSQLRFVPGQRFLRAATATLTQCLFTTYNFKLLE